MNEHKVQYVYCKLLLPRILQQIQMQFVDLGQWVGTVGYKPLFRVVLIITMDAGYRIWRLEDVFYMSKYATRSLSFCSFFSCGNPRFGKRAYCLVSVVVLTLHGVCVTWSSESLDSCRQVCVYLDFFSQIQTFFTMNLSFHFFNNGSNDFRPSWVIFLRSIFHFLLIIM